MRTPAAILALAAAAQAGPVIHFGSSGSIRVNGEFKAIARGEGIYALLRLNGTLFVPPGIHNPQSIAPGTYSAVSCGGENDDHEWVVAIRSDGTLTGSGFNFGGTMSFPPGQFVAVSAGARFGLALRADGTVGYWGNFGPSVPPPGTYSAISAGLFNYGLAIRTDGTIAYWGNGAFGLSAVPPGTFRAVSAGESHALAIRDDDTIVAWGVDGYSTGILATPPGTFRAISAGSYFDAAIRTDGTIAVWGQDTWGGPAPTPPPGAFVDVRVNSFGATALSAGCYPNCDLSATPPILNVQDFSCFLNKFASGDPYANCDNSTFSPHLNIQDFTCFLNSFAAGCAP